MIDHMPGTDGAGHVLATLSIVERRLGQAMAARMAPHERVTRGSHARLLNLVPPDGARPSELAHGWISKQAVGKRIQEMAEAGLVTVTPDPHDGRASIVSRTAEGDRTLALIMHELAGLEAELAEKVGERRYRMFRTVLDELASC
jgi:DNA-binding MarR family transcriptional regulator